MRPVLGNRDRPARRLRRVVHRRNADRQRSRSRPPETVRNLVAEPVRAVVIRSRAVAVAAVILQAQRSVRNPRYKAERQRIPVRVARRQRTLMQSVLGYRDRTARRLRRVVHQSKRTVRERRKLHIRQRIGPFRAGNRQRPVLTRYRIVRRRAGEHRRIVRSSAAIQHIVAGAAKQRVGAGTAGQRHTSALAARRLIRPAQVRDAVRPAVMTAIGDADLVLRRLRERVRQNTAPVNRNNPALANKLHILTRRIADRAHRARLRAHVGVPAIARIDRPARRRTVDQDAAVIAAPRPLIVVRRLVDAEYAVTRRRPRPADLEVAPESRPRNTRNIVRRRRLRYVVAREHRPVMAPKRHLRGDRIRRTGPAYKDVIPKSAL